MKFGKRRVRVASSTLHPSFSLAGSLATTGKCLAEINCAAPSFLARVRNLLCTSTAAAAVVAVDDATSNAILAF